MENQYAEHIILKTCFFSVQSQSQTPKIIPVKTGIYIYTRIQIDTTSQNSYHYIQYSTHVRMKFEPVIGLEIHVQLKTKSKMFCSCPNDGDIKPPNTCICPVCMGHPGTLPVPNKCAAEYAIKAALAIGCTINPESKFDRKHYFYPDLPKGYQISQFDQPIGENGQINIETKDESHTIRIERLHLEEDAAKNLHDKPGVTHIDYNRAGTPLAEIVTHPDFNSPTQARIFLQELRLIMRTIDVSDADMEKGHLRCDANISLRPSGSSELFPKTEVKNLNSFKAVERAIAYEIKRQTKLWQTNTPPKETTTRGWSESKQQTYEQRSKEQANDYRYFPEPDIPPLLLAELTEITRASLPELPQAKRFRFAREYFFKPSDINLLIEDKELANFAEHTMSEAHNWLYDRGLEGTQEEILEKHGPQLGKLVGGWITSKLFGLLSEKNLELKTTKLTPENFAELMAMIMTNTINSTIALKILDLMIDTGADPSNIVDEQGWQQVSDSSALENIIEKVIKQNPNEAERYCAGKTTLIQFFVGKVMKETKGSADPELTRQLLKEKLS